MSEIKIFEKTEFGLVRTIIDEQGEAWFVGKDITKILGYKNHSEALLEHVDTDDRKCLKFKAYSQKSNSLNNNELQNIRVINLHNISELWQGNDFSDKWVVNESGLYSLIISSKLPAAKQFKRWITSEVLPSIRKTGSYSLPTDYISALEALVKSEKEKKLLALENECMKPKADYYDAICERNLLVNLRDTAKELHQSPKQFIEFLLSNKYLYRDNNNQLRPIAKYAEKGLFELKEWAVGSKAGIQTLVTTKGRDTFRNLLNQ